MIKHLGWGTFLLWGVLDLGIAAFSWFCLQETRGRTLEGISGSGFRPDAHKDGSQEDVNADGSRKVPQTVVR